MEKVGWFMEAFSRAVKNRGGYALLVGGVPREMMRRRLRKPYLLRCRYPERMLEMVPEAIEKTLAEASLRADQIDFVVPHQANSRIVDAIAKRSGIPRERFLLNIEQFGNTAAASVGLAFHQFRSHGSIAPGHTGLLLGFGGGLSWGTILIRV